MILLITVTTKTLAFILGFTGLIGFIVGCCFMNWGEMHDQAQQDADVINLDEYETFDSNKYPLRPKYDWRKETTVNN